MSSSQRIDSSDPNAIAKLELRLAKAKFHQGMMVAANMVARSTKLSPDDKRTQFEAMGADINKCMRGYTTHELANNRQRIARLIMRIEQIKAMREITLAKEVNLPRIGKTIVVRNGEDYRVEVFLPRQGTLDLAHGKLHSLGFRYSHKLQGWQRQLNPCALYNLRRFIREMGGPDNVFKNASK